MGKQTKKTKGTSAPTVQRISKEEFNKLRKRSIRNKVIAGVCTFIVGAGVGAGAYYGISDCWLNKDVPTPPPIEQGQTEEPTVSNVKNFASANEFRTDKSIAMDNIFIEYYKKDSQTAQDKNVTLNMPLKIKIFEASPSGAVIDYIGEVNIEQIEAKGVMDTYYNGTLAIEYSDLVALFPEQLSNTKFLGAVPSNTESIPDKELGYDYYYKNEEYLLTMDDRIFSPNPSENHDVIAINLFTSNSETTSLDITHLDVCVLIFRITE